MCCGGGSTQQASSSTTLDPALKERYLGLLDRANTVSQTPYTPYGAPRVAPLTPDQQAGFQQVRDLSGSTVGGIDAARTAISGNAGAGAINAATGILGSNPGAGDLNTAYGYLGQTPGQGALSAATGYATTGDTAGDFNQARSYAMSGAAPLAGSVGTFDAAALAKYGNPYQNDVISAAQTELDRQRELSLRDQDTRAATSGGVGSYGPGVRAGLERTSVESDASRNAANVIAQLKSQNYAQAQGQFNTEQNRGLSAAQNDAARQAQAASQYGSIGDMAQQLALQRSSALGNIGAAENQYNLGQASGFATLGNAANQYNLGQGTALASLGTGQNQYGLQQGQALGSLTDLAQQLGFQTANAQTAIGGIEQGQTQASLDTAYQDFLRQQGYPQSQIDQLSAIYHGYPSGTGTTTNTAPGPSVAGQLAGAGIAGLSALGGSGAFGANGWLFADGGIVDAFHSAHSDWLDRFMSGGIVGHPRRERGDHRMASGGRVGYAPGGAVPSMSGNISAFRGMAPEALAQMARLGIPGAETALAQRAYAGDRGAALALQSVTRTAMPPRSLELSDLGVNLLDTPLKGFGSGAALDTSAPGPDYTPAQRFPGQPPSYYRGRPGLEAFAPSGPAFPPSRSTPGSPIIDQQGNDIAAAAPAMDWNYGDVGAGRRGIMTGGGASATAAKAALRQAGGASADAKDPPSWAMPMMVMGLSMMASKNPTMLGAIGEGGIGALQTFMDQRRYDKEQELANSKAAYDAAKDERTFAQKDREIDVSATNAEGLAAYRQSGRTLEERKVADQEKRTDIIAKKGFGGAGSSPTERIIADIRAEAKAAGKPISTADASRLARGAAAGNEVAIAKLAQTYADKAVGDFNTDPQAYKDALAEGEKKYRYLGGGSDAIDTGDNQDTVYNFDTSGELLQ